jgi:hypothetical protein
MMLDECGSSVLKCMVLVLLLGQDVSNFFLRNTPLTFVQYDQLLLLLSQFFLVNNCSCRQMLTNLKLVWTVAR